MACNNKNCGCQDTGLTTPAPCSAPSCPNPEPCAETFSDCCIIHNGDSYVYIGKGGEPGFTVLQGERLCDIWQRFIAFDACPGDAPYGLKSKLITSTTINVAWTPLPSAVSYDVYISEISPIAFTNVGTVLQNTTPNFTITGLTPATSYYVNVTFDNGVEESCASVSLILTTLSA